MTRRSPLAERVGVVAVVGVVAAVVSHYALRVHTIQPDEALSLGGMRFVLHHGPSSLFDWGHVTDRGLERITPIILGVAHWIAGGEAAGVRAQRIVIALLYAVAAVPAWLLARGLGLRPPWALAAAALAVLAPFAVFATSFLNTAAAYATVPLAFWGMWRAAVRPSAANDLLAIALVALAGMARVGNVVVGVALPVGVIAQLLRDRAPGQGLQWRSLPRRVWREHRVLVVIGVLVVAGLLVAGPTQLGGEYALHFGDVPGRLRARFSVVGNQLGVATGFLPLVLAGAWMIRQAVRPTSLQTGTFAWMAIACFVAIVYVSTLAGPEERYIAPIVPVVAVMFVAALARREVGIVTVALVALFVGRAIVDSNPIADFGPYTYFAAPAGQFFSRVVLGKASLAIPWEDHHVVRTVVWAGVIALAATVVLMRRAPRLTAIVLIGFAAVYGAASGAYAMRKFSEQAGIPGIRWEQQTWIDRAAKGQHVAILDYDPMLTQAFRADWTESYVWNRSVIGTAYLMRLSYGCCPPEDEHWELHPNRDTGRIRFFSYGAYGNGAALPHLLLWSPHFTPYGFDTDVVASSTYLPVTLQLLRLNSTSELAWSVRRAEPDGYVRQGGSARVRVFADSPGCLQMTLKAPTGFKGVRAGSVGPRAFRLHDETPLTVQVPVRPSGGHADLIVRARDGTRLPDQRRVSLQILDVARLPGCAATARTP